MKKDGYKTEGNKIVLNVDAAGRAFIYEGNHRLEAATRAGVEHVPVELRYNDGGERAEGFWKPDNVVENFVSADSAITTASEALATQPVAQQAETVETQPVTESVPEDTDTELFDDELLDDIELEPTAATPESQVISTGTSTGDVIREGDYVYKNVKSARGDEERTLEDEVYQALEGSPHIVPGVTVTYRGEEKIRTAIL